jgi:hypothetical protein
MFKIGSNAVIKVISLKKQKFHQTLLSSIFKINLSKTKTTAFIGILNNKNYSTASGNFNLSNFNVSN